GTVVHATHNSTEPNSGIVVGIAGLAALQLEDGALLQSDWNMAVGGSSGSDGALQQTGGTALVHGTLTVGNFAGSNGVYELDDGALSVDGAENIGLGGEGAFTQAGGSNS